jgi:hypothetical protein
MTYISACLRANAACFLSDIMATSDDAAADRDLPRLGVRGQTKGNYGVVGYVQKTALLSPHVAIAWAGMSIGRQN